MDVYIHKDVLGFKQHLMCQATSGRIVRIGEELPDEALLVYGDPSLLEISKLYSVPLPPFPPTSHVKALQGVLGSRDVSQVPWSLALPPGAFMKAVEGLGKELLERFSGLDLTYYQTHYRRTLTILQRMVRARIDPKAWKYHSMDKDAVNPHVLATFEPDEDGFAGEVVYSRCETKTGRLKVMEGPQILHLAKEQRNILGSRFGSQGKVMQLDYSALEPRVVLLTSSYLSQKDPSPPHHGNPPLLPPTAQEGDLYLATLKSLGITDIPRDSVKEVILSQIYGAGMDTILGKLSGIKDARGFMEAVEEFFGVPALRAHLIQEYEVNNREFILSAYGRRVDTSEASLYMLLNYYIQPTAVDVAFYGFRNILRHIQGHPRILPLFILHDALILDVHNDNQQELEELREVGSKDIPLFPGARFPLKVSRF